MPTERWARELLRELVRGLIPVGGLTRTGSHALARAALPGFQRLVPA